MASIGEKIKEVFTGHSETHDKSDVKTPDVNAPGAYPTDKNTAHKETGLLSKSDKATSGHKHSDSGVGIEKHGHGHGHHDPEVEAKQATSAAGNYPYWGDLPHEDQRHNVGDSSYDGKSHSSHGHGSGLAAGTTALAGGSSSLGQSGARDGISSTTGHRTVGMTQDGLPDRTRDSTTATNTQGNAPYDSKHDNHHRGEAAAAAGAGALGAGYLASRHKDDSNDRVADNTYQGQNTTHNPSQLSSQSTTHNPSQLSSQNRTNLSDRVGDNSAYPSNTTSSYDRNPISSTGASRNLNEGQSVPEDHHRRNEGLLAGAGAAGLGAAGYNALKKDDDKQFLRDDRPTTTYGSGNTGRESTTGQTAGGFGNDSDLHNRGGVHNTVIGAGSSEHPQHHSGTSGSHAPHIGSQPTASNFEQQRYEPRDATAQRSGDDRKKYGPGAAGLGAGAAGVAAAEHKHRHAHDDKSHDLSSKDRSLLNKNENNYVGNTSQPHQHQHEHHHHHQGQGNTQGTQPAHAAAAQAWNKHEQPYEGSNDNNTHRHANYAPAAAGAAGLGAAGATAAYYGQGRDHEQNPRTNESQKIADRALGSDGAAHAPSHQSRDAGYTGSSSNYDNNSPSFGSSGPSGYSGTGIGNNSSRLGDNASSLGSTGNSHSGLSGAGIGSGLTGNSKVLHKCHQCGADNDISKYFGKDATFKLGS